MKHITFRQLQTNTSWLNDLPVEVTRYGKPVAVVVKAEFTDKVLDSPKIIQKKEKEILDTSLEDDRKAAFMALRRKLSG